MASKEVIDYLNGLEFAENLRTMVDRTVKPLNQDVRKLQENVKRLDAMVNVHASLDRSKKMNKNKIVEYIDDAAKGNKRSADLFVEVESDTSSEGEDNAVSGQSKDQHVPEPPVADAENVQNKMKDFDELRDEPPMKKFKPSDDQL